jgi:hypothetical protein
MWFFILFMEIKAAAYRQPVFTGGCRKNNREHRNSGFTGGFFPGGSIAAVYFFDLF